MRERRIRRKLRRVERENINIFLVLLWIMTICATTVFMCLDYWPVHPVFICIPVALFTLRVIWKFADD